MNELEFLRVLKQRAAEQEKIVKSMPLPAIFSPISIWFGNHPWRIIVPISFLISIILHYVMGDSYDSLVLAIFGGLGILDIRKIPGIY